MINGGCAADAERGVRGAVLLGCGLCAAALLVAVPAHGASPVPGIDCKHAQDAVTKTICSHADLRKLDARMTAAYKAALRRCPQHAKALRQDQRDWLAGRDDQAWRFLSQPIIAADTARKLRSMYETRIEFLRHAFDVSALHSAFLKHVYHWIMAGGVPGHDLLVAAGAHKAKETGFDNVAALLRHLPAPAGADLHKSLQHKFGNDLEAVTLAWLPAKAFGGAYVVEGSADCAYWTFFQRHGNRARLVPHPKVNGGCWNHALELVQWRHRAIAVDVGSGLETPTVDLQLQAWQGDHWGVEERLRLRFARKVALKAATCAPQLDCAAITHVGMRVAVRYDRRPLPQTLAPSIAALSKPDRARFEYLRKLVACARDTLELPYFGKRRRWVGMRGFGREAAAFPVRVGHKLALGCISHAHLGWRRSGVWLVGMWTAKNGKPVPLAGMVAGGEGAFLVAAPLQPRVVRR